MQEFFRHFHMLPAFSAEAIPAYLIAAVLGAIFFLPTLVLVHSIPEKRPFLEVLRAKTSLQWKDVFLLFSGAVFGFLTAWRFGMTFAGLTVLAVLSILTAVTLIDHATCEIPDRFPVILSVLALLSLVTMPELLAQTFLQRLIGFFSVSLPLFLITCIVPGAFGGGDIKLMAPIGFLLGWKLSAVAAFAAILTGGLYGVFLLLTKKKSRKSEFAFGPFLCFGIAFALFLGDPVVAYYTDLFSVFTY